MAGVGKYIGLRCRQQTATSPRRALTNGPNADSRREAAGRWTRGGSCLVQEMEVPLRCRRIRVEDRLAAIDGNPPVRKGDRD